MRLSTAISGGLLLAACLLATGASAQTGGSEGLSPTLSQFGIPEAGLLMIMGIDTFLDMGRSATNVIGNSLATAVVAKWEGELKAEHELGPDEMVPTGTAAGEPALAGH